MFYNITLNISKDWEKEFYNLPYEIQFLLNNMNRDLTIVNKIKFFLHRFSI